MANLIGNPKLHRSARWLLVLFYAVLTLGGATMIYPFWMMVTGSVSGSLDFKDRSLIPDYLTNRDELFLRFLGNRYSDLQLLSDVYGVKRLFRPRDLRGHVTTPDEAPAPAPLADWREFITTKAHPGYLMIADRDRVTALYKAFLEQKFNQPEPYGMERSDWEKLPPVERMNRAYRLMEQTLAFVKLPPWKIGQSIDGNGLLYADYAEFLQTLPPECRAPVSGASVWERWFRVRHPASAAPTIPSFRQARSEAAWKETWEAFLNTGWPRSLRQEDGRIRCVEDDWQSYLKEKYSTDAALAAAWGDPSVTIEAAPLLQKEQDAALFVGHESALRWRMMTENYIRVGKFLVEQGYAVKNTMLLVGMAIVVALVLNPLAAYGLSRYPGRHGRSTLLVMVMTIAFPSEVAMIPSFLLLRDLDLLNTFAALILPGAVSGFSIFLLKGFFDGLPEDLFDACTIDGANGMQVFWHVVLPLSRPILAVIALGTFTGVYGGYMWALLVCQDPKMWTLMVWLFQFQINFADQPWLGMAAFVIASIPTLLVFLFCQRLILRGIIIPTEK